MEQASKSSGSEPVNAPRTGQDSEVNQRDDSIRVVRSRGVTRTREREVFPDSVEELLHTPPSRNLWLGGGMSLGTVASNQFYGLTGANFSFGGYIDRSQWLNFNLAYYYSPIQSTNSLSASLDGGVDIISIGFDLKKSVSPPHTFLGFYYFGGAGVQTMFWKYKNPVVVTDGPLREEIPRDAQFGYDFHFGGGMVIGQISDAMITAEVSPGIRFWAFNTVEGFKNDVFSPFLYVDFRIQVHFAIGSW